MFQINDCIMCMQSQVIGSTSIKFPKPKICGLQSCLVNPDACVPTRIVRINESSGLSKHRISGKNKINLTAFYIMDNAIELADRYFSQ